MQPDEPQSEVLHGLPNTPVINKEHWKLEAETNLEGKMGSTHRVRDDRTGDFHLRERSLLV
jgi:hypothetical protein